MQKEKWEKMHKSILFTLQPTHSNKTFIIDLFRRLFNQHIKDSETCLANPFYYLKHSAALLSDQDWIKISDRINASRVNECDFQSKSFAVNMLAELSNHFPSHIQQSIIKKLLPYLSHQNDHIADTVSQLLKKYSYIISKKQRSDLFKEICNKFESSASILTANDLTIIQIHFLVGLIDSSNKNEILLLVETLHKKILDENESIREQVILELNELFLIDPPVYFNMIIQPILRGLKDQCIHVQIQSIRSLAKIAYHSSYEKRKMIVTDLCSYFIKRNSKKENYFKIETFFDSSLLNEQIEISLKFLLEDKPLSEIETNFLASLEKGKCSQFISSLCMNFSCRMIYETEGNNTTITIKKATETDRKNIIERLGELVPIIADNHDAITKISEKILNNLSADLIKAKNKDVRNGLIQLSSLLSEKRKTMLTENLYKKLSGKDLNDLDLKLDNESTQQKIDLADAFEFLTPLFSETQLKSALIIAQEMLIDKDMEVSKNAIIALGHLMKHVVDKKLILAKEKTQLTSQLCNRICSSWLEDKENLTKNQMITIGRLASIFSSAQRRKIMDSLFEYISSDTFFLEEKDDDINDIFKLLLPHLTALEKAYLYILLITLEQTELIEQFSPITDHLYISLYELPQVISSCNINNIIESYLAPRYV